MIKRVMQWGAGINGKGKRTKSDGKMQLAGVRLTLKRQKAEKEKEQLTVRGHGKDTRVWEPGLKNKSSNEGVY